MSKKLFWTLSPQGNKVLRDLETENENFTIEDYRLGKYDANNYIWFEMFQSFSFQSDGCDYERMGCQIEKGDVVLDIGANIGVFAHRAEMRGASKVYCFEPMTPTFECLLKNKGPKTFVYKNAVGSKNTFMDFKIHTDFSHIGGASFHEEPTTGKNIIFEEKALMVNINDVFTTIGEKVDFFKLDIEGGEIELLNEITDENLSSVRCLSAEFHEINEDFNEFQRQFWDRALSLGFNGFCLYHGDGKLRTLSLWK